MPEDTKSLVLIVDDPDAPSGLFTHWLVGNRRMHAVLDQLGIPCGYQEFPGIAHNLNKLAEQVQIENFRLAAKSFR